MIAIITCQNPEIWFSEMIAVIVSTNVGNYNFANYWQFWVSEMLAIILLEMLATNVSNYLFGKGDECQKCWRQMSVIIIYRNAGDMC